MKKALQLLLLVTLFFSCSKEKGFFDCYLSKFSAEQQKAILDLHATLDQFLMEKYPTEVEDQRIRLLAKNLLSDSSDFRADTMFIDQFWSIYSNSELNQELDFMATLEGKRGLHFLAQESCLAEGMKDTLVEDYIEIHEIMGDIGIGGIIIPIAESPQIDVSDKMLIHNFIVEYLAPICKHQKFGVWE